MSVRLSTDEGSALYAAAGTPDTMDLSLVVEGDRVGLRGPVDRVGDAAPMPVGERETVRLVVYVSTTGTDAFSYRLDVPVRREAGGVQALTPYTEVCTVPARCGGEAAYVPASIDDGVSIDVSVRASNGTATRRGRG